MKAILIYLLQVAEAIFSFFLFTALMAIVMPISPVGWIVGMVRKDEDRKEYWPTLGNLVLDGYQFCWNGLNFKKKSE